ncbi:MAG: hypothetical protein H7039_11150, partial [Bryobacteraceae bacterium]|nr:hypothetical protein [Bryobacteraceae bacterium]
MTTPTFEGALNSSVLNETIHALTQQILATTDTTRTDRLWPADPIIFQTNPLNIAYGACGTALFLKETLGALPSAVTDWICAQPIDNASYPPGLYSGVAGVAWTFAELGMLDRAWDVFRFIPESPLAFRCSDIFNGAAGWGLAALHLY